MRNVRDSLLIGDLDLNFRLLQVCTIFRGLYCGHVGSEESITLGEKGMDEGDIKHAQWAGGKFANEMQARICGRELECSKLVAVARYDDNIGDRMESVEERCLLSRISGPRVDLGVMHP